MLRIICSRTVFGTCYQFGELTSKYNAKIATLTALYSTMRVNDDDDVDVDECSKFKSRFVTLDDNRSPEFRHKLEELLRMDWKPFEKNFYKPPDIVHSKQDIADFLSKHKISVTGPAPSPIMSFDETCLPDYVTHELKRMKFTKPTPIQAQCWPIALSGQNLIGIAKTGSGKTLSYLLPAVVHIKNQEKLEKGDGPIVLVLAPTRELAQQIQRDTNYFFTAKDVRNACVFGGGGASKMSQALRRGCEIVIATPRRLIDFLDDCKTNLGRCTYLVLDEADLMFRMGLETQIRNILERIRPDRQTLMFSAARSQLVRQFAEDVLDSFTEISVGFVELRVNHNIKQVISKSTEFKKEEKLMEMASSGDLRRSNKRHGKILNSKNVGGRSFNDYGGNSDSSITTNSVNDNVTEITDDEYNNLCSHFIDKVFIGNKSTPQEMYSFMKFIDKTRPYDFVIDGLNLALGTDLKSHLAQSNMLVSVVKHFADREKKILVIGRKHMEVWPKPEMNYIRQNAKVFLIDNSSQDDPFFLLATLLSGPKTDFVTRDLIRDHAFKLDNNFRTIFRRWQQQHQYNIKWIDDDPTTIHLKNEKQN